MFSRFENPPIAELKTILSFLPAADRETWFKTFAIVGRAYNQDAAAFGVCKEWARGYSGRKPEDEHKEHVEFYDSSRRSGPGIGALIKLAKSHGYKPPVSKNENVHVHGTPIGAISGLDVVTPTQGLEPPKNPSQNGLYGSAQEWAQRALKFWAWDETVPNNQRAAFMRRYCKAFNSLPVTEAAYLNLMAEFCNSRSIYSFDAFTDWAEEQYSNFDREEMITYLAAAPMSPNHEAADEEMARSIQYAWQLNLQRQVEAFTSMMSTQTMTVDQAKAMRAKLIELTEPFNPQLPALTGHDIAPIGRRCIAELLDPELSAMYYTPTGYEAIDRYIYGWRRGEVSILGAHSGVGKTWFGVDASNNVIQRGGNVLFITTEMAREAIVERMFCNTGRVSVNSFKETGCPEALLNSVSNDNDHFYERDESIHIVYANTLSEVLQAITSRSDLVSLDLVVIDYIQNITNDLCAVNDPQYQKVKNTMERLSHIATKCNCPMLALAQLNNPNRKAGNTQEPSLYDMSSASYIVQDAPAVMVLYKVDIDENTKELRARIVKSRYGSLPEAHFSVIRTTGSRFEFAE